MGLIDKLFGEKTNMESTEITAPSVQLKQDESAQLISKEDNSQRGKDQTNHADSHVEVGSPASTHDFSDYRLVMALSQAVQQKFKDYSAEMTAAIFLAMTDKTRNDLVERPEGIYISRQCWEKMLSYDIWLAADGQIIITRKGLGRKLEKPKEDAQQFLNRQLPYARHLGRMSSLHYAMGLALTFGLNQNSIIVRKDSQEAEIYY